MPIPLVVAALASGGSLVAHSSGGLIVLSAAGSYVAGTYLSTAAIATILTTGSAILAGSIAVASGAAGAIVGSAGVFGTTIGATGLTGVLMSAGLIYSTPVWVPVTAISALIAGGGLCGYKAYHLYKIRHLVNSVAEGEEAHFTERQARVLQALVIRMSKSPKR